MAAALSRSVPVKYEWVEVAEHDVESGLVVMFGVSLSLAIAALAATCGRGDANATAAHTAAMVASDASRMAKGQKARPYGNTYGNTYGAGGKSN